MIENYVTKNLCERFTDLRLDIPDWLRQICEDRRGPTIGATGLAEQIFDQVGGVLVQKGIAKMFWSRCFGDLVVLGTAEVDLDSGWVEVAALGVYGHTEVSAPRLKRRTVALGCGQYSAMLDWSIWSQSEEYAYDGKLQDMVANTQGVRPVILSENFIEPSSGGGGRGRYETEPFHSNRLIRAYGNATGNREVFGYRHVFHEEHRDKHLRDLGAMLHCPGNLVHRDGSLVMESEFRKAVLSSGQYFHRDTPSWIRYTFPDTPYKDRPCRDMRLDLSHRDYWTSEDEQHMEQISFLSQFIESYEDPDSVPVILTLMLLLQVPKFLFQVPGEDKGTYRWKPGQARARGRILMTGVDLGSALQFLGLAGHASAVFRRTGFRAQFQINAFAEALMAGGNPLVRFSGHDGHSPGEHGIWWVGLMKVLDKMEDLGLGESMVYWQLSFMQGYIARYCFDSFAYFNLQGERRWATPYVNNLEKGDPGPGPSDLWEFAWLAATNAKINTMDPAELAKMENIKALGDRVADRFKSY